MRVLGVDPGLSGALALWSPDNRVLRVEDMPTIVVRSVRSKGRGKGSVSEPLLVALIRDMAPDFALVEAVGARPGQGVTSMFSFGTSYGIVRGALAGLGVPFSFVQPQAWRRYFRLPPDKQAARAVAARLVPASATRFSRVCDDGRADATLIAIFGGNEPI